MVNFCAVIGCSNRSNRDKRSFYRLPSVPGKRFQQRIQALGRERREKWLAVINRAELDESTVNLEYIRVCSDHFISGRPSSLYDKENSDWAPNQNLEGKKSTKKGNNKQRTERLEKHEIQEGALALLNLQQSSESRTNNDDDPGVQCQTELTSEKMEIFERKCEKLEKENTELKEELRKHKLMLGAFFLYHNKKSKLTR